MKLRIEYYSKPVQILGVPEPLSPLMDDDRLLFIDDKPVPKALADIILIGLDVAANQYLDLIEELRQQDILI